MQFYNNYRGYENIVCLRQKCLFLLYGYCAVQKISGPPMSVRFKQ